VIDEAPNAMTRVRPDTMYDSPSKEGDAVRVTAGAIWIWGVPGLCLILLLITGLGGLNRSLFLTLNALARHLPDGFWALLSLMGNGLIAFVVLTPWIHKKPGFIWSVVIASILFLIFGQGLKNLLDWPRPPAVLTSGEFHLIGPALKRNAFPSGHSAQIFALCGVFCLTTTKKWLRILLVAFASMVAFSRVAVGVHWPQDIAAGALLGWVMIWLGIRLANASRWGWHNLGQKILGGVLLCACFVAGLAYHSGYDVMGVQRFIAAFFFIWGFIEYLKIYGFDLGKRLIGT
jgi:membrane-associated phospholipid phosphatase